MFFDGSPAGSSPGARRGGRGTLGFFARGFFSAFASSMTAATASPSAGIASPSTAFFLGFFYITYADQRTADYHKHEAEVRTADFFFFFGLAASSVKGAAPSAAPASPLASASVTSPGGALLSARRLLGFLVRGFFSFSWGDLASST
jgi:hypothetical protein